MVQKHRYYQYTYQNIPCFLQCQIETKFFVLNDLLMQRQGHNLQKINSEKR